MPLFFGTDLEIDRRNVPFLGRERLFHLNCVASAADKEGEAVQEKIPMPDRMAEQASALPLPLTAIRARPIRMPRRFIKMGVGGSILFAGIYGVIAENKYISTNDAVISTYVLAVRTPIDGTVTGLPLAAGVFVHHGDLLGRVDNPRVNLEHLDNLLTVEDTAQSTADALVVEQQKLARQQRALVGRSNAHIGAVADRLKMAVAEAERLLEAKKAALQEATIELERGRKLHEAGILDTADYDKLVSAQQIADKEHSAQQADLDSVRGQAGAAERGLLAEPGANNDVSYSRQRADELAIKLAENSSVLLSSQAQADESQAAVEAESTRAELMRHTDLRSPIDGLIWKLNAVNSEHAASGDSILSLVDCRRQFLVAEVPQNRLPDITLRETAHFRLVGESQERTGTVLSVSGDAQYGAESKLAAFPRTGSSQGLATVIIDIDNASSHPDVESCLVGRSARVLIPTASTNLASRWIREHF